MKMTGFKAVLNPPLGNVPMLYPLKIGLVRGLEMVTLTRKELTASYVKAEC